MQRQHVIQGYTGAVTIGALSQLHELAAIHVADPQGDEALALLELAELDATIAALREVREHIVDAAGEPTGEAAR